MNLADQATASSAPGLPAREQNLPDSLMVEDQSSWQDVRALSVYQFMEDTFTGDNGYRDGTYLIPHPKESFYQKRRARSVYNPVFQAIISAMTDPVFACDIVRDTNNEHLAEFVENVDNAGTRLDAYLHQACDLARVMGFAFTVVDNFSGNLALTVQENLDRRRFPYIYLKKPYEVHYLLVDQFGRLQMIEFTDKVGVDDKGRKVQYYRRWDAQCCTLFYYKDAKDGERRQEVVEDGFPVTHDLGQVPVVVHDNFQKIRGMNSFNKGLPRHFGMAFMCFHLYNKESEVVTLEDNQCFSILYTSGINVDTMAIGPKNYIECGTDAKFPPGYASPDPQHLTNLVSNCDRIEEKVYKLAKQMGVIRVADAKSGVAKEWDFRAEETVLKQTVTAAREMEEKIVEVFGLYLNQEGLTLTSQYPENFSPSYESDRATMILKMLQEAPSEVITDELWRELVEYVWKYDEEKVEEIFAKLDAALAEARDKKNLDAATQGGEGPGDAGGEEAGGDETVGAGDGEAGVAPGAGQE